MRFPRDAAGWPLTEYSRMVLSRPHRWHIQETGTGPTLLLIHGAGGATQSWRALFPLLAQDFHVVSVDLPGQGFTQLGARMRCGLNSMAQDLSAMLAQERIQPDAVIGHSAGAAIALRLVEDRGDIPVIGINAALDGFDGLAGWLFPLMAKALAMAPFTADIFVRTATPATVDRLLEGTGSRLDADGKALYRRLATDRGHVDATLAMMSQWSVDGLVERLPRHTSPTLLIAASRDGAVPPEVSARAADAMPNGQCRVIEGYGHLVHEEAPEVVVPVIHDFLRETGIVR